MRNPPLPPIAAPTPDHHFVEGVDCHRLSRKDKSMQDEPCPPCIYVSDIMCAIARFARALAALTQRKD